MTTFLAIILIGLMIATVVAMVRGIVAFLQESTAQARSGEGPSPMALQSNRMMQKRILFQALAVAVVVVILSLNHRT